MVWVSVMHPSSTFPPAYPAVARPAPVLSQGFFATRRPAYRPTPVVPQPRREEAPGGVFLVMAWATTIAATWLIDLAGSPTTLHFFDSMFAVQRTDALNVPQLVVGTALAVVALALFVAARRERRRHESRLRPR